MRVVRIASAAAIAAAIVVAAACDFPSPLLFDVDKTDSGGSSGTVDGADPPKDASEDVADDATADADAKPCSKPCDCDDDGFLSLECDGSDCDDDDPDRHPDAGFSTRTPPPGKNGDWNCDGVEEKSARTGAACEATPPDICADASGFLGDPSCGATATFVQCGVEGVPEQCVAVATPLRTVECR